MQMMPRIEAEDVRACQIWQRQFRPLGEPMIGRLLLYEALGATFTELKVRRDPDCPICSRPPEEISDDEMGVFPDYEAFCAAAG